MLAGARMHRIKKAGTKVWTLWDAKGDFGSVGNAVTDSDSLVPLLFSFPLPHLSSLPHLCRKPTRPWPTRRSCTWWSTRDTAARCPSWWPVPKTAPGSSPCPRTRSPTPGCTGKTSGSHREANAQSGWAWNAPSGSVWAHGYASYTNTGSDWEAPSVRCHFQPG